MSLLRRILQSWQSTLLIVLIALFGGVLELSLGHRGWATLDFVVAVTNGFILIGELQAKRQRDEARKIVDRQDS